ncbi:MAG TPA: DUF448 domain-containing protein [Sandaracinaceae bacterium LLY-WYZ-13_1]|nr:DUF448 domain-containing protein [Sandaracinaceae bacterium LLY-WYZ-13_1]
MLAAAHEKKARHAPTRTCVGCREEDGRDDLLRFVVRDEAPRLVPDVRRRLPGRGVSVHPTRACMERAVAKGGFARALRGKVDATAAELCEMARLQYERRLEGLVAAALRNGSVAVGTDAVRAALSDARVRLLVVAADAAGRREELSAHAERLGHRCVVFGTKAKLGGLFGRAEVGVLAILDEGIAREVAQAATRAMQLAEETE